MPELPDLTVYIEVLRSRLVGERLLAVRIANPFVLRSVTPPLAEAQGKRVVAIERIGKRIVIGLEDDLFLVVHLMIAGRFRWRAPGGKVPGKLGQAFLDFAHGMLVLTEAGTTKRASLHLVRTRAALAVFERGGLEVDGATLATFAERLRSENHTVKRALTDPRLFSGIGNAYSDEILHRARLSPLTWTTRLHDDEVAALYTATQRVLTEWTARLREEAAGEVPEKVTAFRPGMAVHGKYGHPCPDCGAPVQRIRYADNETNYCARCQTGGRLLADRGLSRLLKDDWPRSLDDLEREGE